MKIYIHTVLTIGICLIISRFIIRIVDATVQIGDDIWLLVLLLVIVNALILIISNRCRHISEHRSAQLVQKYEEMHYNRREQRNRL